jgi:catechol 2,3-dioxygenase-like lactoylglutathione lyase family enzyme
MNRISLVCLGVRDMEKSLRFYRDGLGFSTDEKENNPHVVFFNTRGTKFELCPLNSLAEDVDPKNPPPPARGFAGITLAYNVKNEKEVDELIKLAKKAGALITKEPQKAPWGGYHGYFSDPAGYDWDAAYNPPWSFDENDMIKW